MRITHLGHAAVLLETSAARVLIDPGNFSDTWHSIGDLDAVLVTHKHPDHLDPEHVPDLLAANSGVKVYVEPSVATDDDYAYLGAEPLAPGEQTVLGDLLVEAVGGEHAVIHRDMPEDRQRRLRGPLRGATHGLSSRRLAGPAHPTASTCWPFRRTGHGRR